jgi:hypothetical protein
MAWGQAAPAQHGHEGGHSSLTFSLYAKSLPFSVPDANKLLATDPTSGQHVAAPHQFPDGLSFYGLAYDRHREVIWTIAANAQGAPVLTSLNPFTGNLAYVEVLQTWVRSLTYRESDGLLYGLEFVTVGNYNFETYVRTINPHNGHEQRVVKILAETFPNPLYLISTENVLSMAFDPLTDEAYFVAGLSDDSSRLFRLDLETGKSVLVSYAGFARAMAFLPESHQLFTTFDTEGPPFLFFGEFPDGRPNEVGVVDTAGITFVPHVPGSRG